MGYWNRKSGHFLEDSSAMARKSGFKNIKLGKNVYRQIKRRGAPQLPPEKRAPPRGKKTSRG